MIKKVMCKRFFSIYLVILFLFGCVSIEATDFIQFSPDKKLILNGESFTVYDKSTLGAKDDGSLYLKTGLIVRNAPIAKNLRIKYKVFGSNKWGQCNFLCIYVNKKIDFDVTAHYSYIFKKSNWDFTQPVRLIKSKNGQNIYAAFVPYSPYNETSGVNVRVDFKIKDQLIMQFGHSFENVPFEWEKQTITFNTEKTDELSNSDKERVKIERKKRFDTWAVNTETYAFHNGFGYPVSNPSIISSEFGLHRKWVYAKGNPTSDVHTGLDYPDAEGTPIYASADGRVAFAEYATYLGNAVFIDHGLGVYSVYMHNHKLNVDEGDTVKKGDLIAYMGMTGAATGPHCHWEIRIFGMPVDPRSMLFINSIKF